VSDTILYNYGQNYDFLDGIKSNINDATALREDVHKVFNALTDVYTGEAATGLQAAHAQCSQTMDGVISDMTATHAQGVERQATTAAQDAQLSQNF
jgi:uncharacterized protein YukE